MAIQQETFRSISISPLEWRRTCIDHRYDQMTAEEVANYRSGLDSLSSDNGLWFQMDCGKFLVRFTHRDQAGIATFFWYEGDQPIGLCVSALLCGIDPKKDQEEWDQAWRIAKQSFPLFDLAPDHCHEISEAPPLIASLIYPAQVPDKVWERVGRLEVTFGAAFFLRAYNMSSAEDRIDMVRISESVASLHLDQQIIEKCVDEAKASQDKNNIVDIHYFHFTRNGDEVCIAVVLNHPKMHMPSIDVLLESEAKALKDGLKP